MFLANLCLNTNFKPDHLSGGAYLKLGLPKVNEHSRERWVGEKRDKPQRLRQGNEIWFDSSKQLRIQLRKVHKETPGGARGGAEEAAPSKTLRGSLVNCELVNCPCGGTCQTRAGHDLPLPVRYRNLSPRDCLSRAAGNCPV